VTKERPLATEILADYLPHQRCAIPCTRHTKQHTREEEPLRAPTPNRKQTSSWSGEIDFYFRTKTLLIHGTWHCQGIFSRRLQQNPYFDCTLKNGEECFKNARIHTRATFPLDIDLRGSIFLDVACNRLQICGFSQHSWLKGLQENRRLEAFSKGTKLENRERLGRERSRDPFAIPAPN
jgi:hypothetical protein